MDGRSLVAPHPLEARLSFLASSPAAAFRADTDQAGEWYVWTRLSHLPGADHEGDGPRRLAVGWATMHRCESRELAQRLADDLNQRALRVAV